MSLPRALSFFATFLFLLGAARATADTRPNVLVIMADQLSADALSSRIGDRWLRTPHIDSLVQRGTSFTRAYVANPICVPSRTALFTGRYPHETGVLNNDRIKVDSKAFPTLGTTFRTAGYATGYVGKWHVTLPMEDVAASGFEFSTNIKNNGSDAATPLGVVEFLRRPRAEGQPFLLVASLVNPHDICEWARGDKLPEGEIGTPPPADQCPPAPTNLAPMRNEPDATAFARKSYQAGSQFPVGDFDVARWRQYRWAYYRMIEKMDADVGRVLQALRDSGQADNTVIVFTSDHGDCQGAHGWNQKTVFYEESSRVPFIIVGAKTAKAATSDRLVQTGIDLIPTLCDFAGISIPAALPGLSQRAPAEGAKGPDPRSYVVVSNHLAQGIALLGIDAKPAGRMLRSARYKYCVYDYGQRRESLVDLERDPGETTNLADDPAYAQQLDEHRQILTTWSRQTGDKAFPFVAASRQP